MLSQYWKSDKEKAKIAKSGKLKQRRKERQPLISKFWKSNKEKAKIAKPSNRKVKQRETTCYHNIGRAIKKRQRFVLQYWKKYPFVSTKS